MNLIDLECHLYTPEYLEYLRERSSAPKETVSSSNSYRRWYEPSKSDFWMSYDRGMEERLLETGKKRIQDMDQAGVDVQVLSLTIPAFDQLEPEEGLPLAKRFNDQLAEIVARFPERFRGWAALAPRDPEGSAKELRRAVEELNLVGAMVQSHLGDEFLDHKRYEPLLEEAASLNVPIYIHPTVPHENMLTPYLGYGWELAGTRVAGASETALHLLRMILGGVFDRFPDLTVILGHLGEGLPFWLYRIQAGYEKKTLDAENKVSLKKSPRSYVRDNVFVTTSGAFSEPLFKATYSEIGAERILFSSDYPYEDLQEAADFFEQLSIPSTDKQRIGAGNAEALLGRLPR